MRSQPHAPVETVDVDRKYVGTRTILLCGFLAVPVPPDLTRVPTTVSLSKVPVYAIVPDMFHSHVDEVHVLLYNPMICRYRVQPQASTLS